MRDGTQCVLVIIYICDSSCQDFNQHYLYGKLSLLPNQFPNLVPLFLPRCEFRLLVVDIHIRRKVNGQILLFQNNDFREDGFF